MIRLSRWISALWIVSVFATYHDMVSVVIGGIAVFAQSGDRGWWALGSREGDEETFIYQGVLLLPLRCLLSLCYYCPPLVESLLVT